MTNIEAKILIILSTQFDVDAYMLDSSVDIQNDLGADSLDMIDLLIAINDKFDIQISEEQFENLRTIGELTEYICRALIAMATGGIEDE